MLGIVVVLSVLLAGCGGGSGNGSREGGNGVGTPQHLAVADATRILTQAGNEAATRGIDATIVVVDRVGNVLGAMQVGAAGTTDTVSSAPRVVPGPSLAASPFTLEGATLDSRLTALAKAITGAYLSSNGNAFTTRTASQIVQEHFNIGVANLPGGPLFGVQFSQLPCGDLVTNVPGGSGTSDSLAAPSGPGTLAGPGPHRSPLGLSADPGGLPLYKNGTLVGGIGVITDRRYGLDRDITDFDTGDVDEIVALAGQVGFAPPSTIRANLITVNGFSLRYVDASPPGSVNGGGALPGALVDIPGYYSAADGVREGTTFLTAASGVVRDPSNLYPGVEAYVLVDNTGAVRPESAGRNGVAPAGQAITATEAQALVVSGLKVAFAARAQIRRPISSFAQVTVSVVDLDGNVLALARTPDAPLFGTDVSVQKARTAAFFSRSALDTPTAAGEAASATLTSYTNATAAFLGLGAFPNGMAFSARSIGNMARPFYPDGIQGKPNGPLSLPFTSGNPAQILWSPFGDGLQLDLVAGDIVGLLGGGAPAAPFCGAAAGLGGTQIDGGTRIANGIQIFSGGVPIYRGNVLVGGMGVSGDGIFQDDMIAFLGVNNVGGGLNNAPAGIRSDTLNPGGEGFLRYVNCPQSPFLESTADNVCDGL